MAQIFCLNGFHGLSRQPSKCIYEDRLTLPHCTMCDRDARSERMRERVLELLSRFHSRGSNPRAISLRSLIIPHFDWRNPNVKCIRFSNSIRTYKTCNQLHFLRQSYLTTLKAVWHLRSVRQPARYKIAASAKPLKSMEEKDVFISAKIREHTKPYSEQRYDTYYYGLRVTETNENLQSIWAYAYTPFFFSSTAVLFPALALLRLVN